MNFSFKNLIAVGGIIMAACNSSSTETATATDSTGKMAMNKSSTEIKIKEEPVTYKDDTVTLKGYITYNENAQGNRKCMARKK